MKTKITSSIITLLLIANIVLFALGRISSLAFWVVILICALFAYKILPKLAES